MAGTIHSEFAASSFSTIGPHSPERSALAQCCINSAAMLELADTTGHSNAQRARFRELNANQAKLLREAANMADDLLDALRKIAELQRDKCMHADSDMLFMVLDNKVDIALAAIAKATGETER